MKILFPAPFSNEKTEMVLFRVTANLHIDESESKVDIY